MPTFGIFSDIIAVRDKTPHIKLPAAYMTEDSQRSYYDQNGIERMPGRSPEMQGVVSPDGNPILKYWFHRDESSNTYAFIYTKANAYIWDSVNEEFDLMHTCASDCTHWSVVSFNGKVISTNYVDKVLVWLDTTPATQFAVMGSASGIDIGGSVYLTKAKYVAVYETYIHFMYVEEGGVTYPARDTWSSRGDETDFDRAGSGDAGKRDFKAGDWITGAAIYSASTTNLFIVFTNKSIEKQWLVSDSLVFDWSTHKYDLGCPAPDSIVNDGDGNVYFLGTDKAIHVLFSDQSLSLDIESTIQAIHPTLNVSVRAYYFEEIHRIWWSIPKNGESTQNDRVVSLNLNLGSWDPFMDIGISAFGEYSQQITYTIDTIPFDTIDSIGWATIDGLENVIGQNIDICGSYDGYTYKTLGNRSLDANAAYTSEVVLGTDLTKSKNLDHYKRCDGFWVWFKRFPDNAFTATISVKTDEDTAYETLATVDFTSSKGEIARQWCPCDFRGRDFLFKISTTNDFIFYGMKFRFTWDGEE